MEKKNGYVGLGKMGKNMVFRLLEKGVGVVAWNRSPEPLHEVTEVGAIPAVDFTDMIKKLPIPRIIWVMLPAGEVANSTIEEISNLLSEGDILIDGGNSNYKVTLKNAEKLTGKKIHFLDAGISGGPSGARNGACVMVGGEKEVFEQLKWLFEIIAAPGAFDYFGKSGAGHFVKMVHNGIEYGMMQAIAEGYEVLARSPFNLDLPRVTNIYANGSVISSRLIDWLKSGFEQYGPELLEISGSAQESGEGRWTADAAAELGVEVKVIEDALAARAKSRGEPNFQGKIIQTLRNQFGGHKA
jgi:6-phosphogluconate dehydrogenase